jgi:hypothetical protein
MRAGWQRRCRGWLASGFVVVTCITVTAGIFAKESDDEDRDGRGGGKGPIPLTVPKAVCGAEDHPETGLQGQVPAPLRMTGFKGFNCNLTLIGSSPGEGASWQHAFFADRSRHQCSYYDTASPEDFLPPSTTDTFARDPNGKNELNLRQHLGVVALDVTNPRKPMPTTYLTTSAMLDPWESMKVNERRQMLGAELGTNAAGTGQLDLYDIRDDCRYPQLLSSVLTGSAANGDAAALPAGETLAGHEGNFAPDGLTWYSGDRGTPKKYTATDISDTSHPRLITTWTLPEIYPTSITTHGLTLNEEGTRAYVSQAGVLADPTQIATAVPTNGIIILDTSDVQARKPNPQMRLVSRLVWKDGGQTQHTIPIKIRGKAYLIVAEEVGSGGNSSAGWNAACNAGLPPFNMARIVDISDDTNPKIVSRLMLEIHNPANCSKVLPDLVGLGSFTYGSHYCSVDNKHNATTLACGYFNSGIRVFDIRNPYRPREIAYFNPPAATSFRYGSNHYSPNASSFNSVKSQVGGGADWCNAQIRLDAEEGTLQTTCQDSGFLSLKFRRGVWPFPESSTPPGAQN